MSHAAGTSHNYLRWRAAWQLLCRVCLYNKALLDLIMSAERAGHLGSQNGKMHQSSAALLMEHLELAVSFLSTATAVLRAATSASGKHSTSNAGSPGMHP